MKKGAYKQMKTYLTALIEFGMHENLTRHQRTCMFFEINLINEWIKKYESEPFFSSNLFLQSKMNK
jgi:hypothetical protein